MIHCQYNFQQAQKLQKRYYDKNLKPRSYVPGNKIWLNSKNIKIKYKEKFKPKLWDLFQILYLTKNQAYKIELSKK